MFAVPAELPETIPVTAFTTATFALALDQVPPAVVFDTVPVEPTHTTLAPAIGSNTGSAFTVIVCGADVEEHPFVPVTSTVIGPAVFKVTLGVVAPFDHVYVAPGEETNVTFAP